MRLFIHSYISWIGNSSFHLLSVTEEGYPNFQDACTINDLKADTKIYSLSHPHRALYKSPQSSFHSLQPIKSIIWSLNKKSFLFKFTFNSLPFANRKKVTQNIQRLLWLYYAFPSKFTSFVSDCINWVPKSLQHSLPPHFRKVKLARKRDRELPTSI